MCTVRLNGLVLTLVQSLWKTRLSRPFSPQSVVLKQRRDAELKASAEKLAADILAANKTKREEMVKRCEQYEKEYKQMDADLIAKRREAHNKGEYFVEGEGRLAIVVRIRGINRCLPR